MIPKIYIETSVISYLTARPGRDLVVAAHQQITQEWWENRRHQFELFISQLVIQESQIGDIEAAQKRISTCCIDEGYEPPIICTPEELFGG